jgi:hypothetical protein
VSDRATTALVVALASLAGVALMIGAVSLLTATLGDGSNGSSEISIPYAAAWTAVALALLGSAIAIPFYPHLRIQLVAITAAWAMALVALIAAGGMRNEASGSGGGKGGDCARQVELGGSNAVELGRIECAPAKRNDQGH